MEKIEYRGNVISGDNKTGWYFYLTTDMEDIEEFGPYPTISSAKNQMDRHLKDYPDYLRED